MPRRHLRGKSGGHNFQIGTNMLAPTLRAMAAFRRVVETRSFKGAAASLGLSGGAVSKLVAQLEADLGAQLLTRSTRALSLTEAGSRFYASAVPILDDVDCATAIARTGISLPSSGLKVAVPTSFALQRLAPGLPDFLVAHPAVQLQLSLGDRYVDLVEGGFDCALRIAAHMPDSTLVARRLGQAGLVLAAAPRYLRNEKRLGNRPARGPGAAQLPFACPGGCAGACTGFARRRATVDVSRRGLHPAADRGGGQPARQPQCDAP